MYLVGCWGLWSGERFTSYTDATEQSREWVVYMRGSCFPTVEAVGCIWLVVVVCAAGRELVLHHNKEKKYPTRADLKVLTKGKVVMGFFPQRSAEKTVVYIKKKRADLRRSALSGDMLYISEIDGETGEIEPAAEAHLNSIPQTAGFGFCVCLYIRVFIQKVYCSCGEGQVFGEFV